MLRVPVPSARLPGRVFAYAVTMIITFTYETTMIMSVLSGFAAPFSKQRRDGVVAG